MISWILGIILISYVLIRRFAKNGRIEGFPLGMPRGTVRAIITLMIVSIVLSYIPPFNFISGETIIPAEIVNTIFILVAFYFEARKGGDERLKLLKEIRKPLKAAEEKKKEKKPLYLPKYSVRISLMVLLLIYFIIDIFYPTSLNLEIQNTLIDILLIAILYFIGTFFRAIGLKTQKKKLKEQLEKIPNYQELSKYDILERLDQENKGKSGNFWKSFFSITVFITVVISLFLFTINLDFVIPLIVTTVSLRRALLLLTNLYFGFRD
jgi:hypothetical protein